jgi:two-component system OmpR family sensor kinase
VIARVEQGRLPIRTMVLDAAEALAVVRERVSGRAELELSVPDGLTLVADPVRLQQALANLVDNALRHGGSRVELAAEPLGDRVELHVRDDGPGFPQDFVDTAFERFTRADAARSRGGAGLGLAIVAVIAQAHGGTAGARNRAGGGADVWIALPVTDPASAPSADGAAHAMSPPRPPQPRTA